MTADDSTQWASVRVSEIFRTVAHRMGWDGNELTVRQWRDLRDALNLALQEVWEERNQWWPELMRTERRALAERWSAERMAVAGPYLPGQVVYWPEDGHYYIALTEVHGEPPSAWSESRGMWVETGGVWKRLEADYADAVEYHPGLVIDDMTYTPATVFRHGGRYWLPRADALGEGLTGKSPWRYPQYWIELPCRPTVLPRWDWGLAPIGAVQEIRAATEQPCVAGEPLVWLEVPAGWKLLESVDGEVVVTYRLTVPRLTGEEFDPAATYQAADPIQQIYGVMLSSAAMPEPGIEVVATPVIHPTDGEFTGVQVVTISTATAGAILRYTLDGSVPTETNGLLYEAPFAVTDSVTIRARGFKSGATASDVATSTLTRVWEIRHGTSASPQLTESGVLALAGIRYANDPAGSYLWEAPGSPGQYLYWAWPDALPRQPRAQDGLRVGGLPLTGDLAGPEEGYVQTHNGWPYALVNVGGVAYRVYRTKYRQEAGNILDVLT